MGVSFRLYKGHVNISRQSGTDNLYASWSLTSKQKKKKITKKVYSSSKKKTISTTKKYPDVIDSWTVKWYYKVSKSSSTWFLSSTMSVSSGTMNTRANLFTPPSNAVSVKVTVVPNPKEYQASKSKKAKWFTKPDSRAKVYGDYDEFPDAPSIDTWTITDKTYKAIVSFDTDENDVDYCQIQTLKNDKDFGVTKKQSFKSNESNKYKRETCVFTGTLDSVGSWQVRARVGTYDSTKDKILWSEWCGWSSSVDTRPDSPTGLAVSVIGSDEVRLSWNAVTSSDITKYKIEYVSESKAYFDSGNVQSVEVDKTLTSYIISGISAGSTWYFRIRAVNSSDESDPSDIVSTVLATKPSAPTTWSSKTVATIQSSLDTTDPVYLYWVHNSQDGSAQIDARIRIKIAGITYYYLCKNTKTDDYGELKDETSELELWSIRLYSEEGHDPSQDSDETYVGTVYDVLKSSGTQSLTWMVCTRGLYVGADGTSGTEDDYSDWSVERTINVYAKPNLNLSVTDNTGVALTGDVLTNFPLKLTCTTTPSSQTPISYYISITTNSTYETTDTYGEETTIQEGTEIFSKYVDPDSDDIADTGSGKQMSFTIGASDVDFVSDIEDGYTISVIVYMDSGLTAEATYNFNVEWSEDSETPDAEIEYNDEYRYTTIRPYCVYYLGYEDDSTDTDSIEPVAYYGTAITGTSETPTIFSSSGVTNANAGDVYFNSSTCNVYTCTYGGDASVATWMYKATLNFEDAGTWYSGTAVDGDDDDGIYSDSGISAAVVDDYYFNTANGDIYHCIKAGDSSVAIWEYLQNCFWQYTENTTLSVYRKEQNGTFTAIRENIGNNVGITVLDPHPTFGTCTYRIVSTNTETGGIAYEDFTEDIPETSVVMQWDEVWNDGSEETDENGDTQEEVAVFEGSVLELPANIQLKDSNTNDVTLAEYIGRSRPVSYYGTQRGENPTISCQFPKKDTETLAKLRRLMAYQGDVYIREPSGLGYWANVNISYNRNYTELTIPVSITINPVEGGI